jgi:hypothetical protein
MTAKEIIGALSVAVGLASYGIYLWGIYRRTVRPHVFTWIIWGTLAVIGFAVQYVEKGGPGAWNLGMAAAVNLLIAVAAGFYGEKEILRSDWVAFFIALAAIPVWWATDNPLWAVIIVSGIDLVAFYPTFRKSWLKPQEEGALSFSVCAVQFLLSVFALEKMNLTTVLYPAIVVIMNVLLVLMLLYRRRILK